MDVNMRNVVFYDLEGIIVFLLILGCFVFFYEIILMKMLIKYGVDVNVIVDESVVDFEFLYYYVLKNCFVCDVVYDMLEVFFEKVDILLV